MFVGLFLTLFPKVLSPMKCTSDRKKRKSEAARSDEYGGYKKTSHPNALIFFLACFAAF